MRAEDVPASVATLPRLITPSVPHDGQPLDVARDDGESLHRVTSGHPDQSLLHRELLAGIGVGDIATVLFRDLHGLWGWLDLWRTRRTHRSATTSSSGCAP